ncbi:hypothetical protein OIDMADRAFT_165760 [Oidiodendron maius Zn]|uniref:NmrA-like domain-containing protein n=1 Tax=Oidiodendron maius (strain Zn) TaxID=913774 RepID=A0A0C3HBD7_OIDMZ|nr:hypothetical protein OIDMADRAFT_165760 [Oidiodendron maius Zn]
MTTKILVLGAGELGTAIVTSLSQLAHGQATSISVLLRPATISSPSPAQAATISLFKSLKITIVPGDISSNPEELASLFTHYNVIISCLGFSSGRGSQIKLARAVLAAGVQRYYPWQFGVDYDAIGRGSAQDLFDEQLDVRDLLRRQSATEWVIVSTGLFTSFLFEEYFGVVEWEKGVVRALGGWENEVTVTTPEDIGKVMVEIVKEEASIRNMVLYTAGETVKYETVADVVEKVKGEKVTRETWSVEQLKRDLESDPDNAVKKYRVVFAEGRGVSWDKEKTYNWQKGIKLESLREWTIRNMKNKSM